MNSKPSITVVLDNLRSIYNVGSILRTCDCLGISNVIYIGTTPYPRLKVDSRLPFQAVKQTQTIAKTALGAEETIQGLYYSTPVDFLTNHGQHQSNVSLIALEQNKKADDLSNFSFGQNNVYLIVGNEVKGVSTELIEAAESILEIPMKGRKESLNVEVATAIALYQLLKL